MSANICKPTQMPNKGFLFVIANSLSVSTKPLILFREPTQLLNEPYPGKTILSLDLIFFISDVTSKLTLPLATSVKELMTELILPDW